MPVMKNIHVRYSLFANSSIEYLGNEFDIDKILKMRVSDKRTSN